MRKMIFIIFGTATIAAIIFVSYLNKTNQNNTISDIALNSTIIEIYNGYKGKPNYQIALLKDSTRFTLLKTMLNIVQVGDSVIKRKGDNFYTIINKKKSSSTYFFQ